MLLHYSWAHASMSMSGQTTCALLLLTGSTTLRVICRSSISIASPQLEISEGGTINAQALKQIKAGGDGVGLRAYDPG
jgi:hypothetical protein